MTDDTQLTGPAIYEPVIETMEQKMAALAAKRARNDKLREEQAAMSPSARLAKLEQQAQAAKKK